MGSSVNVSYISEGPCSKTFRFSSVVSLYLCTWSVHGGICITLGLHVHEFCRLLTRKFWNRCEPSLAANAVLLDRVRSLTSLRRKARVQSAASVALKELVNLGFGVVAATSKIQKDVESLLRGQTSLAEYPYATLLTSVSFQ